MNLFYSKARFPSIPLGIALLMIGLGSTFGQADRNRVIQPNGGRAAAELRHLDNLAVTDISSEALYEIIGNPRYDLYSQAGAFTKLKDYAPKPAAYYYLARCYITGKTGEGGPLYVRNQGGLPPNRPEAYELAVPLFQKAAELGHVPSILSLADLFASGRYVERDMDKAAIYWSMAAAKGDEAALAKLKEWYFGSPDTENNRAQRAAALKVLAENGVKEAKSRFEAIAAATIIRAPSAGPSDNSTLEPTRESSPLDRQPVSRSGEQPSTNQAAGSDSSHSYILLGIVLVLVVLFVKYPRASLAVLGGLFVASAARAAAERNRGGGRASYAAEKPQGKIMNYYQCEKCGTTIKSGSTPSGQGCPKSFPHKWHKLGTVGSRSFQCSKCGTVVEIDSTPSGHGCPNGFPHKWSKL
ncbi:MAG: tetratricopeptide repeat protein [Chthoniobacterales bacterium]